MGRISRVFDESLKKTQDGSMFINTIVFEQRAKQLQQNILESSKSLDELNELKKLSPLSVDQRTRVSNLETNIKGWEDEFRALTNNADPIGFDKNGVRRAAKFRVVQLDDQTARIFLQSRSS